MKNVLLSFDIEEFDMPLEYARDISFEDQIRISTEGCQIILDILSRNQIRATFFSTVTFALNSPEIIKRIISDGHELASHGVFHSAFQKSHLKESRIALEELTGRKVNGFRMARMMPVSDTAISDAGYLYNSSLNPVFLPGRYNNFFKPRTMFLSDSLIQFPASATPVIRFPLFWLSFHNLPLWLYQIGCSVTMAKDNYLNIYFHPWEFIELRNNFGLPSFVSRNSGDKMVERFQLLIDWMKNQGYNFQSIVDFLISINKISR
jgi:peptidoglycan/xylan/chitin deacetylase (PgdA/CDA1 family)